MGGHAGRGETSLLWSVTPGGVDLTRIPPAGTPGPHFAMGDDATESDRRAGERMHADIVASLGASAKALLAEYDRVQPTRKTLTFADIEDIWEDDVRPALKELQLHAAVAGAAAGGFLLACQPAHPRPGVASEPSHDSARPLHGSELPDSDSRSYVLLSLGAPPRRST